MSILDEIWTSPVEYTGNNQSKRTFEIGYKPLAVIIGSYIGGNSPYYLMFCGDTSLRPNSSIVVTLQPVGGVSNFFDNMKLTGCVEMSNSGDMSNNYSDAITITSTGFTVKYPSSGPSGNWGLNSDESKYCYWCRKA